MSTLASDAFSQAAAARRGLWLGVLGVAIFSVTLPMTRLAVGTPEAPLMSGSFVALARAVLAAGLSALYLAWVRAPWPARQDWGPLAMVALGVVFGDIGTSPLYTSRNASAAPTPLPPHPKTSSASCPLYSGAS